MKLPSSYEGRQVKLQEDLKDFYAPFLEIFVSATFALC